MENIHKNTHVTHALILVLLLTLLLALVKLANAQNVAIPGVSIQSHDVSACTGEDCALLMKLPLNTPGWKPDFNIRSGKKPKWYLHTAQRLTKKKRFAPALAHAAFGLKLAKKAKTTKKLTAMLTQDHYDAVYAAHEALEAELGDSVIRYTGITSASQLYTLLWSYKRLLLINTLIDRVRDQVSIQTKPVDMTYIGELEGRLTLFREQAAAEYFAAGSYWLSSGKNKDDYKRAAIYFKICRYYNREHEGANDQYEQARELAMTHIDIARTESASPTRIGYTLDEDIRAHILADKRFARYQFVDILSKGRGDYTVRTVMDNFSLTTRGQTSDTREFSKEIETGKNADGSPIIQTKTASVTTYSKGYNVSVKVNMEVIDNATQTVIHAAAFPTSYVWETVWQSSRGELSIVKSKYKTLVGKKPDTAPHRNNLYRECVQQAAPQIAHQLVGFFGRFNSIHISQ